MIQPSYLQKGDTVAIVSTARKITSDKIIPAIKLLEKWGLQVIIGETIGSEENQFSGSDEKRIADFQQMLDNPKVKAIWCARGGYGTVRIIDLLDFTKFSKKPKWVMGFSDVTVLHSHLNTLGIATLHSIMPFTVPNAPEKVKQTLNDALFWTNLN